MTPYIGTKQILARPMTRGEYNSYRGWDMPSDEVGTERGYLVEYPLGEGKPNLAGHEGYVSWSPAHAFEPVYREFTAVNFGHALEALKQGKRVARAGWNGKDMFLVYVPGTPDIEIREGTPYSVLEQTHVTINPHIDMYTATGEMQPGWLASQADMLATDWQVLGA